MDIPEASIRRMSIYLRCIRRAEERGEELIHSRQLAERCGTSPSLIRKDLSYFGGFGIKGKGYRVKYLRRAIEEILGINEPAKVLLVGAGSLGRAVLRYLQEVPYFQILAAFDRDGSKWGMKVGEVEVLPSERMEEFLRKAPADLAVLCIPPDGVQEVVNLLGRLGVKGILSFALSEIKIPSGVELTFVDIASELEYLYYKVNKFKK